MSSEWWWGWSLKVGRSVCVTFFFLVSTWVNVSSLTSDLQFVLKVLLAVLSQRPWCHYVRCTSTKVGLPVSCGPYVVLNQTDWKFPLALKSLQESKLVCKCACSTRPTSSPHMKSFMTSSMLSAFRLICLPRKVTVLPSRSSPVFFTNNSFPTVAEILWT